MVPRVHLCNQDVSRLFPSWSAPIANGLKDPISFSFFRILISIGFPVSGIVDSPFLLTELLCDPIVRIGIHFDSLPIGFSGLLTLWTAAAILLLVSWDKHRCAMETGHRFHSSSPGWMSDWNKRIKGTIWNFDESRELNWWVVG